MEQAEIYKIKLKQFEAAVNGFSEALKIEERANEPILTDVIKNGKIQKFEYCAELAWKLGRNFLFIFHGLERNSPKSVIKGLFEVSKLSNDQYKILLQMIDDRNRLSHIYKEEYFEEIYLKLEDYKTVLMELRDILN